MARPENLPAWVGWSDAYEKPYIPPNYAGEFAQQFGYSSAQFDRRGRFGAPSLPIGNDVYLSRSDAALGMGGYRAPRNDIPPGSLVFGVKDDSSHGGLRGALSNFWRNSGETILKIISFYGTLIGVGGIFGVGPAASSAAASTSTASTSTAAETSTMQLENWTDFGSASDAAVASNAVVSEPSFWDRLTGIGERALEYGVKQAISKEIFGDNQQPISTRATAAQAPINNALPERGFASSVPYYKPAADMSPFIWLAGGFALVLVLILGLSRR